MNVTSRFKRSSILTSEAHHEVKRLELEELNLGEEVILLGKIGEAGTSEPFNRCYILFPLRVERSGTEFGKIASAKSFLEPIIFEPKVSVTKIKT